MRRAFLLLVTAVFALLAAGGAGAAAPTPYTDPVGDSGAAADIQAVRVTNDARGQYTFDITFGTPLAGNDQVSLFLDSDQNASTGSSDDGGANYVFDHYESDHTYGFSHWNGSSWDKAPNTTVTVTRPSDTEVTFSVNRSELGGTSAFDFWVASWDGTQGDSAGHQDVAPDGTATWQYAAVTLSVAGAHATPARAGHAWAIAIVAKRSDTGGSVGSEGKIACKATAGAAKLPLAGKGFFSDGSGGASAAACSFSVSKKLKHRLLRGTITVSYNGVSVARTFTARVK